MKPYETMQNKNGKERRNKFSFTHRWQRLFSMSPAPIRDNSILPIKMQIKAWRKAIRKMGWAIGEEEFETIEPLWLPPMTAEDSRQGFIGSALFYGFGDDGAGGSDAVLSGKLAWEYAVKIRKGKTWRCEYVDFNKPQDIRLRPDAPPRARGFYWAKIQPGAKFINMTVAQLRKRFETETGLGPEGFQFLCVTHPHFAELMSARQLPFMALADYDVAPYGFNDFFDAPQLFCSNQLLGLGIGNVDRNYPLFGIPTLRLDTGNETK
jgi:hypothetical protein